MRSVKKNSSAGFTLLEVLIVLVIVVVIAFIGTNIVTGTFRSKSREVSWHLMNTIRYLYNSSVTENKTVRLVFDFETNSYWAEATSEKFLLENPDSKKDDKSEDEIDTNKEDEGKYLEPIEATFGSIETPFIETRALPSGIYIKDIYTQRDKDAVGSGRAYIYFFPNGTAEAAVINLRDESDERHISIKINPFNGEADVASEYRKLVP